jgi:hypothetical protein
MKRWLRDAWNNPRFMLAVIVIIAALIVWGRTL